MAFLGATQIRAEQDLWGLLFEGDLRIKRQVGGVFGPLEGPFNNTRFALIPQTANVVNRVSRLRGSYGQNLDSISRAVATQFGVAFDDAGKMAFELALRGQVAGKAQVAGSVTAQDFILTKKGSWYKLPHEKLTANPTFTGNGGTPALVIGNAAGNDIGAEIDLDFGYFFVRADAAQIAEDDTIEVSYSYDDLTGSSMDGDQIGQNIIYSEFVGMNESAGIALRAIIRQATVSAGGELNMVGDEFANFDFTGEMSTPGGASAPYTLEWWALAA